MVVPVLGCYEPVCNRAGVDDGRCVPRLHQGGESAIGSCRAAASAAWRRAWWHGAGRGGGASTRWHRGELNICHEINRRKRSQHPLEITTEWTIVPFGISCPQSRTSLPISAQRDRHNTKLLKTADSGVTFIRVIIQPTNLGWYIYYIYSKEHGVYSARIDPNDYYNYNNYYYY